VVALVSFISLGLEPPPRCGCRNLYPNCDSHLNEAVACSRVDYHDESSHDKLRVPTFPAKK
jgi:hypothetical protein